MLGVLLLGTLIAALFIDDILAIMMRPIEVISKSNPHFVIKKIMTTPFDGIMIKMKTALLGGIVLAFPFMLYFIWNFVSSGLKKKENRAFIWICLTGTISFSAGVVYGYFMIAPVLNIMLKMGIESTENYWTVKEFINFVFYWVLGAGLVLELPLAMVILTGLGVIQIEILKKIRPYFIIGAFVLAAIITPPDPITMLMVGIPLVILYEIGILIASLSGAGK